MTFILQYRLAGAKNNHWRTAFNGYRYDSQAHAQVDLEKLKALPANKSFEWRIIDSVKAKK